MSLRERMDKVVHTLSSRYAFHYAETKKRLKDMRSSLNPDEASFLYDQAQESECAMMATEFAISELTAQLKKYDKEAKR